VRESMRDISQQRSRGLSPIFSYSIFPTSGVIAYPVFPPIVMKYQNHTV